MSACTFSGDTITQSGAYCITSRINQKVLETPLTTRFTRCVSGSHSAWLDKQSLNYPVDTFLRLSVPRQYATHKEQVKQQRLEYGLNANSNN
jgi:hypothetical protein